VQHCARSRDKTSRCQLTGHRANQVRLSCALMSDHFYTSLHEVCSEGWKSISWVEGEAIGSLRVRRS